jgi:hypothetical protein
VIKFILTHVPGIGRKGGREKGGERERERERERDFPCSVSRVVAATRRRFRIRNSLPSYPNRSIIIIIIIINSRSIPVIRPTIPFKPISKKLK